MGLINIDALLKLNRLRDKKVFGNKKNIEVCKDSHRLLKDTENYKYDTVEVLDTALHDLDNKGIVDELFRMTFDNKKIYNTKEIDEGEYQYWKGTGKKCNGHYLKYNKVSEVEHPFDLYFRICEKVFYKQFESFNENSIEVLYEGDHRSQGRLLAFEYLSGTNLEFNKTFSKNFNLDITNIDDFKLILLDEKLALEVRKYITRCVAIEAKKIAWNGRNQDYILKQKKVDGKLETRSEQIISFSLDMPLGDDDSCDGHNVIEGVYEDESELNVFVQTEKEELRQEDNLYKYLLSNIDNILTKKQLLYLKAYLNNEEETYLSSISDNENNHRIYRHNYKKKIREYITKYLDKDLYTINKNNKYDFKQSILLSLEDILKQNSNKEIFVKLCNTLQNNKNNEIEKILIDILYELEPKYYTPIVAHINFNSFFDKYIENDFIVVIQALQSAYNWHGKNNIVLYNLNRNDKELIVETKMKSLMNNNKEGYISKSKSYKFMSIKQLREFFEEVEGIKVSNKQLKEVLNKYNYDIDLKSTKKNHTEIYIVMVLGTEIVKKKVAPKKKRIFDLTIDQSKSIENYIDSNLKLDKLLNCKKDLEGHLRICDVRSFVEDMLSVKPISINELREILLQCNFLLGLKNGGKQINGVKVSAYKIEKVD